MNDFTLTPTNGWMSTIAWLKPKSGTFTSPIVLWMNMKPLVYSTQDGPGLFARDTGSVLWHPDMNYRSSLLDVETVETATLQWLSDGHSLAPLTNVLQVLNNHFGMPMPETEKMSSAPPPPPLA